MKPVIGALVLAAGASTRTGDINKVLFEYQGMPLLGHVIKTLKESTVDNICIVTGFERDRVTEMTNRLRVQNVYNPNYQSGMASSLITGIGSLGDVDGAIVCLADMPHVKPDTIDTLINEYASHRNHYFIVPKTGERRGNPVLLGRGIFPAVLNLTGNQGARVLFDQHPNKVLEVSINDNGSLIDYDTAEQLKQLP